LTRDDDYGSGGKPTCDWDDADARCVLVAELAADAHACLVVLDGRDLVQAVTEIGELLATVVGPDLEEDKDGRFRIARKVAKDRVISTVDPDARHGHKTASRGFDGYKGHIAEDPDSEIITNTTVTPGNAGDGSVAEDLIEDLLDRDDPGNDDAAVYGDSAYGGGEFQQRLEDEDIDSKCRTQPPAVPKGRFGKDRFTIDLEADTVTCPNNVTVTIRRGADGKGIAYFANACTSCPMNGLHRSRRRAHHPGRHSRSGSCPGTGTSTGHRVERRLPRHPTQSRTQARTPHATTTRRPPSPGPWQTESRRRLQPARRRRQRGAPRSARASVHDHRMGDHLMDTGHHHRHHSPKNRSQ